MDRYCGIGVACLLLGLLGKAASAPAAGPPKRNPELVLQLGHPLWITRLQLSRDGKYLASGDEASARLWDLNSGEQLLTLPTRGAVALAPDGSLLVTSTRNRLRLWRAPSGTLRKSFVVPGETPQLALTSRLLVAGGADGHIRIWNPHTGRGMGSFPAHAGEVKKLAAHDSLIATSGGDAVVRLWDAHGRNLRTLHEHATTTDALTFSPDGQFLAGTFTTMVGGSFGGIELVLWNVETGDRRALGPLGGAGDYTLDFSPDGRRLLAASWSDGVTMWDLASRTRVPISDAVLEAAVARFYGSGDRLIAGMRWDINVLDARTGRVERALPGFAGSAEAVAISPDGRWLASSGGFERALVWDLQAPGLAHILPAAGGWISKLVFSPDGRRLACMARRAGSNEWANSVEVWRTGDWTREHSLEEPPVWGQDLAFSPDSRTLLVASTGDLGTGTAPSRLCFWNLDTGSLSAQWPPFSGVFRAAVFTPDGRTVASRTWDAAEIRLQDARTGELQGKLPDADKVDHLAFSPDGKHLVGGGWEGRARIWDFRKPGRPAPLAGPRDVQTLTYASGGSLAVVDREGSVWLREPGRDSVLALQEPHLGFTRACAWLPEGRGFVTTGEDTAVKLWDRRSHRLLATLQYLPSAGEKEPGDWIIYTPEGYYEASPDGDRRIRWRVDGQLYPAARYESRFHSRERVLKALAE